MYLNVFAELYKYVHGRKSGGGGWGGGGEDWCVCACGYVHEYRVLLGQKKASKPVEWELQVVNYKLPGIGAGNQIWFPSKSRMCS